MKIGDEVRLDGLRAIILEKKGKKVLVRVSFPHWPFPEERWVTKDQLQEIEYEAPGYVGWVWDDGHHHPSSSFVGVQSYLSQSCS